MRPDAAQQTATDRLLWLDMAKGYAIFLVVIGHAVRGLMNAGILDQDGIWHWIDGAIYAFHMPFFFALSAYVLGLSHSSAPLGTQLVKRIWRIAVPFLIWTYVFLAVRSVAGPLANSTSTWEELYRLPLPPVLHMWFLWALMILTTVWIVASQLEKRWIGSRLLVPILLFAGSIGLLLSSPPIPDAVIPYVASAMANAPAFFLGLILARHRWQAPLPWITMLALVLALALPLAWPLWRADLPLALIGVPIVIVALFIVFRALGPRIDGSKGGQVLIRMGQASLAIFVAHTIFSAGLRIALMKLGIDAPVPHVIGGIAIGIIGPLGLLWIAQRARIARAVGLA
jgi:fucose 4-O-acetylase-like acetyltransferase